MAVGAVVARILTQYSDKGSKQAQKDIQKLGKNFDQFAKRAVRAFAVAGAAVAAFAVKVGKDAVRAAMDDQKSQVLLANSLRNTTGATNAAITAVENYISKLQVQVGVADDELRPALSKLAAVTGDVAAAQQLLGVALDVSAFSGSDLGTATAAITRALQGNFRTIQKLVPSISAATVKSKDFAAILREIQTATSGAAASRAGTLEFRLAILRIRYSEILETLGYALIPVIERFADTIQKKVLPQIEKWIKENKEGLVRGFETATKFITRLVLAAISFSDWISNNLGLIKVLAVVMATVWATGKIYSFIVALKGIASAFGLITVGANGATAATLRFKAAAGFLLKAGKAFGVLAPLLALGGSSATVGGYPAGSVGAAQAQRTRDVLLPIEARRDAARAGQQGVKPSIVPSVPTVSGKGLDDILSGLLAGQNKLNNAKKKQLSIEEKIVKAKLKEFGLTLTTSKIEAQATATAIEANLKRQAKISVSPTVSLASQGTGAKGGGGISVSNTPQVQVNITTPVGTKEDFIVDITNSQKKQSRRSLGGGGGMLMGGLLID